MSWFSQFTNDVAKNLGGWGGLVSVAFPSAATTVLRVQTAAQAIGIAPPTATPATIARGDFVAPSVSSSVPVVQSASSVQTASSPSPTAPGGWPPWKIALVVGAAALGVIGIALVARRM